MITAAMTALGTFTATGGETSVTFGSIVPYRDLVLTVDYSSPADSQLNLRYNGDSNLNYESVSLYSFSTTGDSAAATLTYVPTAASPDGKFWGRIQIMDSGATDKHKVTMARIDNTDEFVVFQATQWKNTEAITTIECFLSASSFSAGSTINLFGIRGVIE